MAGREPVNELELERLAAELEGAPAGEVLAWAWRRFEGSVAASSSFQTQSVPLLHLISRFAPEMPVLFLDTGFHFPETLAFRDRLQRELGLNVVNLYPKLGHEGFRRSYGELHRKDPDLCCQLNKVEPLAEARRGYRAWVSGIRRDQTLQRAAAKVLGAQRDGGVKVCPLLGWTERDVWRYLSDHRLPEHPLLREGYLSIGCAPCTRAVLDGEDARAGRWADHAKTECGLHTGEGGSTG